jgi:methanogenic corrinoid protein MtbC1
MASPDPFCAQVLTASAPALAALSVDRLLASRPGLARRYDPGAAGKWRESLSTRIAQLAAAVAVGSPELFVRQADWDRAAHAARGGEEMAADLAAAIDALSTTIDEELPPSASATALAYVKAAAARLTAPPPAEPRFIDPATPEGRLAGEYLLAVLEGDRRKAADLILSRAQVTPGEPGKLSVSDVYTKVLAPVQRELGRLWHLNESTVAEEHFATATTHMVVSMLYPYLPRKALNGKVSLAASVEGNAHDIGVRMVADHLEMEGFRSVYLGANVPIADLTLAVHDFRVDLLALSASIGTQLPTLRDAIRAVRAAAPKVKILVGGGAFQADPEALADRTGADAYAPDLLSAVSTAKRLVGLSG